VESVLQQLTPGPSIPEGGLGVGVPASELVKLCAADTELYCGAFFPNTFRQRSPQFHREICRIVESRENRYAAVKVFRGGAKTTLLRAIASKRIAYGTSRTIAFVSAAQSHSAKSLNWIAEKIEHNRKWCEVFGLTKGDKWRIDEWITIRHKTLDIPINVVALGITGQVRGLNIADYRPDFIIVDDALDDETAASEEQMKKLSDLVFGALEKSMSPPSESPDATLAVLQTPLAEGDLISQCEKDAQFAFRTYGCFGPDGESIWPSRLPTKFLLEQKQAHEDRQQLTLWLREMECELVNSDNSSFREDWLQYWDILPEKLVTFMGIDPVPPPSDRETRKGLAGKDSEVLSVVGFDGQRWFLCDYAESKGHDPEWTIAKFFELVDRWRPLKVRVETVGYQRALKSLIEKAMRKRRRYVQIDDKGTDKRPKNQRIVQALSGICSNKVFHIHRTHLGFKEQYVKHPFCRHDDILDATTMALDCGGDSGLEMEETNVLDVLTPTKPLGEWRIAP
jgi:hypothetical protein